ncbi:uncharacterized protein L969DRAFT_24528 [Mixia osmundae IAM 14324]|uniref:non-specific serine/threonine protein kinase n=1 Tax=Mixia osmundae (strain CBS 9802 / IAM 14324 / JCM 22182 / KY 12970) TaxID=764103 RepID=G7E744_MIXOS|nr:uncharacterized protein L969DRAFT_24528 [Mixia osmundae IAM 14324]KEI38959.1 hypothetical protein L969DRAFT_24528 [Mixia osmundae IAM 14324]GAA98654.1 hypothetical protein E5Q_05342 [Mixia osmundae IAM 14324]
MSSRYGGAAGPAAGYHSPVQGPLPIPSSSPALGRQSYTPGAPSRYEPSPRAAGGRAYTPSSALSPPTQQWSPKLPQPPVVAPQTAGLVKGVLQPQSTIQIGKHAVTVERKIGEGGFAFVYLVRSAQPIYYPSSAAAFSSTSSTAPSPQGAHEGHTWHVLKRVAVPDREMLAEVQHEVDVMRKLRGHRHIVNFIESSSAPLPGPTGTKSNGSAYEVYILMEYCAGGGIIDMMNTRLQNRLTEGEILKMFSDTVEGVAHMHYQDPPMIHRDLKVENILLHSPNLYKICDFGSTTVALPKPPQTMAEIQAMEAELNKSTTMQYRAPEMCDVWSRKGITTKADIWALGVLLYKLCYYTTPFEEQGMLSIINVQYKIPPFPAYSKNIKNLISMMLQENQHARPNIYQIHERVCALRGTPIKIPNIYASTPSPSLQPPNGHSSNSSPSQPGSAFDSIISPVDRHATPVAPLADNIMPGRRGRPNRLPAATLSTPPSQSASLRSSPLPSVRPVHAPSAPAEVANALEQHALGRASTGFDDNFGASARTDFTSAPPSKPAQPPRLQKMTPRFIDRSAQTSPQLPDAPRFNAVIRAPTLSDQQAASTSTARPVTPELPPRPQSTQAVQKQSEPVDVPLRPTVSDSPKAEMSLLDDPNEDLLLPVGRSIERPRHSTPTVSASAPSALPQSLPTRRASPASLDSSDDDAEPPESLERMHPPQADSVAKRLAPPSRRDTISTTSDDSTGNFDIGPALASIQKFAPKGNDNPQAPEEVTRRAGPPIQAPKPRVAIGSLVSRYETLSAGNPNPNAKASKPAPAPKPPTLRSQTSAIDDGEEVSFSQRFPALDAKPEQAARPPPFKPKPPSMSLPVTMHRDLPSAPPSASRRSPPKADEETSFEGVAKLKERWDAQGSGSRTNARHSMQAPRRQSWRNV